ncbi:MAG: hypothetical protein ACKVP0_10490 [Pirellulaceae bacterium]
MSLKFSIRDLLFLIAVISVACAALANTGIWWHSIVVTATLIGMTGLVIWGTLNAGSRRAFACGWLLFAAGYLMLVFGPWTGNNLGGNFITSKVLVELERRARGDNPAPLVLSNGPPVFMDSDVSLGYSGLVNISNTFPGMSGWTSSSRNWTDGCTTFHSTGHWLFASVFGYIGAHLAAFLYRRREAASAKTDGE